MTLKVVGSGFGRTGTHTLKEALETLGFGPCHHMYEIMANPPQVAHWQTLAAGRPVEWFEVFAGYNAQIDWPGAHVWRQTAAAFPQAKVIHSVRPEDKWWASYSRTIGKLMTRYKELPMPPHARAMLEVMDILVGSSSFKGQWMDKDIALAAYRQREADVRAAIPDSRLLVFDVSQGWEPLCAFLDKPVPTTPFPHRNQAEDFWANLGGEPA